MITTFKLLVSGLVVKRCSLIIAFFSGPISRDMYHKNMIDVPQDLRQL